MNYTALAFGAVISGATSLVAQGGETFENRLSITPDLTQEKEATDWRDNIKNLGEIYSNKKNPWIQKVKLFGRYHHQWSYTDGSDGSSKFSGTSQELRRFRVGATINFLDRWTLSGRINLEDGSVNANRVEHADFDEWFIKYKANSIGFLEDPTIGYGLTKVNFGGEWYASSKKIKTVERSNLSNFFAPDRAAGLFFNADTDIAELTFGFYSTRDQGYGLADWNGGQAYFLRAKTEVGGGDLRADFLYVDATDSEDQVFGFNWAASLTYDKDMGDWDLFMNTTYGSAPDGDVYGIVIMPSRFLIEDRLEAVFRYQWAHSTSDQIRPGSGSHTSVRTAAEFDGVDIARGNDNHTFYAGLNYHISNHNIKVMTGIEYETLTGDSTDTDTEATTVWAAMRLYF